MLKSYKINDINILNISVDEASDLILHSEQLDKGVTVHTINADHVDKLINFENEKFNIAYEIADIVTLDSRIIKKIIEFKTNQDIKLCTGSDLTESLFEKMSYYSDKSICIIGGDKNAISKLVSRYHLVNEIKQYIPPMGFINMEGELDRCLDFINNYNFDIVFIAVGCPQQEILASYLKENSNFSSYYLCIGASIDFLTGVQSRAPKLVQKLYLEWAYRLLQNPKRMFKRYYSNLKILTKIKFQIN